MELKKQARWKLGVRVEEKNTCVYGAWRERRERDRKEGRNSSINESFRGGGGPSPRR